MKLRARLSYIQYIPRARFGIKIYKLCESSSGYCRGFKIYTGEDKTPGMLCSEAVVLELVEPLLKLAHLYIENWYISPKLLQILVEKTLPIGTVDSYHTNMPHEFIDKNLARGEAIKRSYNGILVVIWMADHLLSTIHRGIEIIVLKEITNKNPIQVMKPEAFMVCNKWLGVDVEDQYLASHPVLSRTLKVYK